MRNKYLLALAAILFAAGTIAAELPDFETVDMDKDGKVTAEEAQVIKDFDFDEADKNDDGVIDAGEYEQASD